VTVVQKTDRLRAASSREWGKRMGRSARLGLADGLGAWILQVSHPPFGERILQV